MAANRCHSVVTIFRQNRGKPQAADIRKSRTPPIHPCGKEHKTRPIAMRLAPGENGVFEPGANSMPSASALHIRPMQRADLDLLVDWAAREGWNPGLQDAAAFHAADPGGFLIGELDGSPLAVISAVRYEPNFGFVGFYIVDPAHRGQGHGYAIWQAAMQQLAGRLVGLDGVPAQQANYERSGFVLAHRNIRFEGKTDPALPAPAAASSASRQITPLASLPLATLTAYDRTFFPADRSVFLQHWISAPDHVALGLLDGTRLLGYGVMRPCRSGWKIGPLFADSLDDAAVLIHALAAETQGDAFYLDVPEVNPGALALAGRHRMQPVFETARMYTGPAPEISIDRTYGITTFELG